MLAYPDFQLVWGSCQAFAHGRTVGVASAVPLTCGWKMAYARVCAVRPAQLPEATLQGTWACTRLPTFTSSLCRSLRALAGVRRPEQAVVGEFRLGPSD